MKNIKKIFCSLEKKISQSKWFCNDWKIYNRGTYLQLYKSTWYNHNQGGIHFETYIEDEQIKEKKFPICMHAEEDCPSQREFIEKFLEIESDKIKSWKGYKIINRDYNIFMKINPLNFKNIEQRIFEEFSNLRKLEFGVDQALSSLQMIK